MSVLLLGTSSYAGMGPYVCEIINSFEERDPIYYFLIEDEKEYYSQNIKASLRSKGCIIKRENTKLNKFLSLIIPNYFIQRRIRKLYKRWNITAIHSIADNSEYLWNFLGREQNFRRVFFTVHDLEMHEAKKVFHKVLRQKILHQRVMHDVENINSIVTNSIYQYEQLQVKFPQKQIFYHPFPTLVTTQIKIGGLVPKELEGEKPYILFFGRIELYKGLHLLYEAFLRRSDVASNFKLVIAGSGDVYFPRKMDEGGRVVWLNRYINDSEISALFSRAHCVVFPYISATQSGVLSLSTFYQVPVITSDVPYFSSVMEGGIGVTFKNGDIKDLGDKLAYLCSRDNDDIKESAKDFYQKNYSNHKVREHLLTIYNS